MPWQSRNATPLLKGIGKTDCVARIMLRKVLITYSVSERMNEPVGTLGIVWHEHVKKGTGFRSGAHEPATPPPPQLCVYVSLWFKTVRIQNAIQAQNAVRKRNTGTFYLSTDVQCRRLIRSRRTLRNVGDQYRRSNGKDWLSVRCLAEASVIALTQRPKP